MKKLFSFVVLFLMAVTVFAVTENEAREYYQRCILNLDPIEGCYSVEYRGHGETVFGSAWSSFAETTLRPDVYIVKMNEERDGRFLVCLGDTKRANWQYYWVLERIGTTNAYKFLVFNKDNNIIQSCHVYMESNLRFVVNFNRMGAGGYTSAMNGNTYVGSQGYEFQLSFVKSFPTLEMSKSAQREDLIENEVYGGGTGFALKDGYFITNYHVYGNRKYALVKGLNNNTYRAYFIIGDEANDVAIFQIRDNKFNGFGNVPYTISNITADIGEEAWTIGFPMTDILGNEAKYTKGEINALSGSSVDGEGLKTNDTRLYQISTDITHGNSGGPLFDETGNLIGITSSGWAADKFNSVNYALKSHFIFTLLESAGLRNVAPTGQSLIGQKRKEQIKMVKPFIFQVLTYNNKAIEKRLMQDEDEIREERQLATQEKTEDLVKPEVEETWLCDTIITFDGRRILSKIVNVTSSAVMYKDFLTRDEKVQAISKSEIQAIIFSNGVRQEYKYSPTASQPVASKPAVSQPAASQPISQKKEEIDPMYKNGKIYYYNGQEMQGLQYELFLKEHCQDAYNRYLSGKYSVKWGGALMGTGAGLLLIGGICDGVAGSGAGGIVGRIFEGLGAASFIAGVPVLCVGIKKKNTAYKTFNTNCHNAYKPDRYINLQVCQNGIGVSLTL